jgi:hypothetical protein
MGDKFFISSFLEFVSLFHWFHVLNNYHLYDVIARSHRPKQSSIKHNTVLRFPCHSLRAPCSMLNLGDQDMRKGLPRRNSLWLDTGMINGQTFHFSTLGITFRPVAFCYGSRMQFQRGLQKVPI